MKIPRWLWWKRYFDTGLGLTSYVKYALGTFGFVSLGLDLSMVWLVLAGFLYVVSCFIIGWYWIKKRLVEAENEISNILNPFQVEVREKLNGRKV